MVLMCAKNNDEILWTPQKKGRISYENQRF